MFKLLGLSAVFIYILASCQQESWPKQNSSSQIEWLYNIGSYPNEASQAYLAIEHDEDYLLAKNIINKAISRNLANSSPDSQLVFYAYYFTLPQLSQQFSDHSESIINSSVSILNKCKNNYLEWSYLYALNLFYYSQSDTFKCLESATKIFSLQIINENSSITALSQLCLARAHELNGNHKTALENYLNAEYIASTKCKDEIKNIVFESLGKFYYNLNSVDKASEYAHKQLNLKSIDSLTRYYTLLNSLEYSRLTNLELKFDLNKWYEIANYAKRNKLKRLKHFAFAFLRTCLIDAGEGILLYNIYSKEYPEELITLSTDEPINYYRLIGKFHESKSQLDSAEYYLKKSLDHCKNNHCSSGQLYSINLRFGDFLFSNKRFSESIIYFQQSLLAAQKINHFNFKLTASKRLQLAFKSNKQFEQAYLISNENIKLEEQAITLIHNRDIINMELQFHEQIQLDKIRHEEERLNKIHQSQYSIIAVFIAIFFCILLISTQFLIPIWIIRALGFLAFIFLFEYFIIKLDKMVYVITQQVPWKLFSLKVVLFAILLPLHHWLEKKAINYLVHTRSNRSSFLISIKNHYKKWFEKLNSDPNE